MVQYDLWDLIKYFASENRFELSIIFSYWKKMTMELDFLILKMIWFLPNKEIKCENSAHFSKNHKIGNDISKWTMTIAMPEMFELLCPESHILSLLSEHRSHRTQWKECIHTHTPLVEYGTLFFTKSRCSLPVYVYSVIWLSSIKKVWTAFFFLFLVSIFWVS